MVSLLLVLLAATTAFAAGLALQPRLARGPMAGWLARLETSSAGSHSEPSPTAATMSDLAPSTSTSIAPGHLELASDATTAGDERLTSGEGPPRAPGAVRFDVILPRGTRSAHLEEHALEWRVAMRAIGARLRAHGVAAVVFAHGSFVGSDPTSALAAVEHVLPRGRILARELHKRTRRVVDRVLGDFGNFGPAYVRLFEQALGAEIPCTSFVWSSENHHVGRLEGALDLLRVLATHAELGGPRGRILVIGHSHAGQVFALLTRLLSRSIAAEAIVDVVRARSMDVSALEVDRDTLERFSLDFVTLGAPARYAWESLPGMRSLHVVHGGRGASEPLRQRITGDDWVRRLGGSGSDFPAASALDRRLNASLDGPLGAGFDPPALLRAVREAPAHPSHGDLVLVDYGGERLSSLVSTGLGHGVYTRLDGMLFHASLIAARLYE